MSSLTPKQKRFVAEYIVDSNATQAAIRAGYSAHTANEQGSRLLANASVRNALSLAQEKVAAKLEITAEKVLRDIERTRRRALDADDYSAALKASDMQAKHVGLYEKDNAQQRESLVLRVEAAKPVHR